MLLGTSVVAIDFERLGQLDLDFIIFFVILHNGYGGKRDGVTNESQKVRLGIISKLIVAVTTQLE